MNPMLIGNVTGWTEKARGALPLAWEHLLRVGGSPGLLALMSATTSSSSDM